VLALRRVFTAGCCGCAADEGGLAAATTVEGSPAEAARMRATHARVAIERRRFVERAASALAAGHAAHATAVLLSTEYRYEHARRGHA
jgi:hypothetical protein